MLKKFAILFLTLTLVLCFNLTAQATDQEELYAVLQEELRARLNGEEDAAEFAVLTEQFSELGSYKKSSQFRSYTVILMNAEAASVDKLSTYTRLLRMDAAFCQQLSDMGLPGVDDVEAYALARQAEAAGDLTAAIGYYEQCISVLDSMVRLTELMMNTPVPTPPPAREIVSIGAQHDAYTLTTFSDGTCTITKYTGKDAELIVPGEIAGYRVTVIGDFAFFGNISLDSINLPGSIVSIGKQAFSETSLSAVILPEGVTTIADLAFANCYGLTSVTLPRSLVSVGADPFFHCTRMERVILPDDHPVLRFGDNMLIDRQQMRLISCLARKKVKQCTVPDGVQIIGAYAFYDNIYLTDVTLPDSVTTIADYAFYGCSKLTDVNIPDSVTAIGESAFISCRKLTLTVSQNTCGHQYAIRNDIRFTID